jgi:GT2 family glycosyltransferase
VPANTAVTVIVVAWNGVDLLPDCLDSLTAQASPSVDIVVVDNASTDGTADFVTSRWPQVRVVRSRRNLGFAGGANIGLSVAQTPFVVLLNQDAAPSDGWLSALLEPFADKRVGAVTSKVVFADDGRINNAGVVVRTDGFGYDRGFGAADDGTYDTAVDVFAVSGTACALRMTALRDVGLLDGSLFLYYEDTDLSWRLQLAGWRLRYEPRAVVRHLHAASSGVGSPSFAFYNERNRLLMLAKNAPLPLFAAQLARFVATTVLLPVRRASGVDIPAAPQFTVRLRLKVLSSLMSRLPAALSDRRRATVRVPRRVVARRLERVEFAPAIAE